VAIKSWPDVANRIERNIVTVHQMFAAHRTGRGSQSKHMTVAGAVERGQRAMVHWGGAARPRAVETAGTTML
jgi:ribosomal protein L4